LRARRERKRKKKKKKKKRGLIADWHVVVTAKWYCDDCKENMKNSKRFNGR